MNALTSLNLDGDIVNFNQLEKITGTGVYTAGSSSDSWTKTNVESGGQAISDIDAALMSGEGALTSSFFEYDDKLYFGVSGYYDYDNNEYVELTSVTGLPTNAETGEVEVPDGGFANVNGHIYVGNYELDTVNSTATNLVFIPKSWSEVSASFHAGFVWNYDNNYYYSDGFHSYIYTNDDFVSTSFTLDDGTTSVSPAYCVNLNGTVIGFTGSAFAKYNGDGTWTEITITGIDSTVFNDIAFYGFWANGDNIYYSGVTAEGEPSTVEDLTIYSYVLDTENSTDTAWVFITKTWEANPPLVGSKAMFKHSNRLYFGIYSYLESQESTLTFTLPQDFEFIENKLYLFDMQLPQEILAYMDTFENMATIPVAIKNYSGSDIQLLLGMSDSTDYINLSLADLYLTLSLNSGNYNLMFLMSVYSSTALRILMQDPSLLAPLIYEASVEPALSGKQDVIESISFTDSDAGWSSIDANNQYTLTISGTEGKRPLCVYNSSNQEVLVDKSFDSTHIYIKSLAKFTGSLTTY